MSSKKVGRPKTCETERCQTAYWAWTVRAMLGLDFAKIERLISPDCAAPRDDKGGYRQPQLWRKYGAGNVSPIGNGHGDQKSKTAVMKAEQYVPGSSDIYHSPLWSVLKTRKLSKTDAKKLCEKVADPVVLCLSKRSPEARSLWFAVLKLNADALQELSCIRHVDTLAVLLIYRKFSWGISELFSADCIEQWFHMMVESDHAFATIESRLKVLLTNYDARLFAPKLDFQVGGNLSFKPSRHLPRLMQVLLGEAYKSV